MNVVSARGEGETGKWPSCGLRRILSPCGPEEFRPAGPMAIKGECHCERPRMQAKPPRRNVTRSRFAKVCCVPVTEAAQFSVSARREFQEFLDHDRA